MKQELGFMISEIPFANISIIAKNVGFDFIIVDYEHGGFDYSTLSSIITTAKLTKLKVIIRLSNNERKDIIKLMDMGADGLLLPMTNCKEDAEKLVRYAKYKPLGERGLSTMRAHTLYNPGKLSEYMEYANNKTELYVQIETRQAVENIAEIASVKGISGIIIGPNDLSCDLDCMDDKDHKTIIEIMKVVSDKAKDNNIKSGIITQNDKLLQSAKKCGMEFLSVGSELSFLEGFAKQVVEKYSK